MKRCLMLCLVVLGCGHARPSAPAPAARVDTVTVTQVVEPPLPDGTPAEICLSTGVTVQIHVSAAGDTLIGERRIALKDVRPALAFQGRYAQDTEWFRRDDVVRFDGRGYRRAGVARTRACDELKLVGEHQGVPLFAEVTAPQLLPVVIVPVRPGTYQDYLRIR